MPALVAGIHVLRAGIEDVDGRDKPAMTMREAIDAGVSAPVRQHVGVDDVDRCAGGVSDDLVENI